MISTLDIAWAAGFIEGEGSMGSRPGGSPIITAAQVQKEPIDRLIRIFGGKARQRSTKGFSNKPIWVWTATARRSIEIMMTIYVLMSPKRKAEIEGALVRWRSNRRILKPHASNFCGMGHELTEDNVYRHGPLKKCRACRKCAKDRYLAKRRAIHGKK